MELNREEAIYLLQDDLDKLLEVFVEGGGDKSLGKITIYENWDYHVQLLRDGELPSYSDNPKDWYEYLLSLDDYEYMSEWMSYEWLEDQSVSLDVIEFTGEYLQCYMEETINH